MKVVILKGLPASGKTTYAKELVKSGYKRVNKDDLRAMLDNGKWSKNNEKFVLEMRNTVILNCLMEHCNVVIDDTNLHPKHEREIREMVKEWNSVNDGSEVKWPHVEVEVKFFDTPLAECIKRDLNRPVSVGEKVIRNMYNQFLRKVTPYEPPEGGHPAIIVDVDGTLAHNNEGRPIYDYARVYEDDVDGKVRDVVQMYADHLIHILIVSGRTDDCREETVRWLNDNDVPFDHLFMRKAGDVREDSIVKQEIFDTEIRDKYDIQFVMDDRDRVVAMWRDLGLKVFQVADGDF